MVEARLADAVAAIRTEDRDGLRRLLEASPELVTARNTDHRDYTLLLHAGHYYDADIVRILIEAGSDVHAESRDGATAFSNAIAKCENVNARLLVEAGYVPRNLREAAGIGDMALVRSFFDDAGAVRDTAGRHREINPHNGWIDQELADDARSVVEEAFSSPSGTARRRAAEFLTEHGATERVRTILAEHPEQVHEGHDGRYPLHAAAREDRREIAAMLLEAGASPTIEDPNGLTPVQTATNLLRDQLLRIMHAQGVAMDLMAAVTMGDADLVDGHLAAGADPDSRTAAGHSALAVALGLGHDAITARLEAAGAAILGPPTEKRGYAPLHRAVADDRPDAVRRLLDGGVSPEPRGPMDVTPLHMLTDAVADPAAMVAAFTEAGADLDAREFFGNTVLDWLLKRDAERAAAAVRAAGGRRFRELPLEEDSPR